MEVPEATITGDRRFPCLGRRCFVTPRSPIGDIGYIKHSERARHFFPSIIKRFHFSGEKSISPDKMSTEAAARAFFSSQFFAVVGASSNPAKFGHKSEW